MRKLPANVKVVNSVWNGNGMIKRKVADFYVAERRAEWVADDQIRLVMSHPKNQAAAARAAAWQQECRPDPNLSRLSHAVACFPQGIRAAEHAPTKFQRPQRERRSLRAYRKSKPLTERPLRELTHGALSADQTWKPPLSRNTIRELQSDSLK